MAVKAIKSTEEFRTIIGKEPVVIVDFWATWCGPCRQISPVLEKLAKTNVGLGYYKVDVDEQSEIATEVGIRAMPTFILYVNGKKGGELVGADAGRLQALVMTGFENLESMKSEVVEEPIEGGVGEEPN